jgi:hypothetical protein
LGPFVRLWPFRSVQRRAAGCWHYVYEHKNAPMVP